MPTTVIQNSGQNNLFVSLGAVNSITVAPNSGRTNLFLNPRTGTSLSVVPDNENNLTVLVDRNDFLTGSHNSLANKQGGSGNEYYHLSESQYDSLNTFSSNISYTGALLANDKALATTNVWVTGLSLYLSSGIWLVNSHLTHFRNTALTEIISNKISDGTTDYASTQYSHAATAGISNNLSLTTLVASTGKDIHLMAATSAGSASSFIKSSLITLSTGKIATQMTAIKLQ